MKRLEYLGTLAGKVEQYEHSLSLHSLGIEKKWDTEMGKPPFAFDKFN